MSSILRHAAEGEAITANPMSLVRPPASEQRDSVVPLAPVTVEQIRAALLDPPGREVAEAEQKAAEKAAAKES